MYVYVCMYVWYVYVCMKDTSPKLVTQTLEQPPFRLP